MGTLIGIGFGSYTGGGGVPSTLDFYAPLTSSITLTTGTAASTFTRATTATCIDSGGLVTSCASGEARFEGSTHNGTNDWTAHANSKGILIEEARTNRSRYSIFTAANWFESNCTLDDGSDTAPDGTTTAAGLITTNTSSTTHRVQPLNASYASGYNALDNICVSFYVKPSEVTWVQFSNSSATAGTEETFFNLSGAGSIGTDQHTSSGIEYNSTTGFYRCWVVYSLQGADTTLDFARIYSASADATTTYSGHATNPELIFWGHQIEVGSFPTSYIPAAGSDVIRNADVLTYDYQPSATTGSMVMTTTPIVAANDAVALGHNTSCLYMTGNPRESDDGTNQVVFGNPTVNTETNYGLTWEDAGTPETATYKDGSQINTGALDAGFDPSTNELGIGCQGSTGTLQQSGTYKEIKIYTDAKDQTFMEAAT